MDKDVLEFKEVNADKLNGGHGWWEAAGVATGIAVGVGIVVIVT